MQETRCICPVIGDLLTGRNGSGWARVGQHTLQRRVQIAGGLADNAPGHGIGDAAGVLTFVALPVPVLGRVACARGLGTFVLWSKITVAACR